MLGNAWVGVNEVEALLVRQRSRSWSQLLLVGHCWSLPYDEHPETSTKCPFEAHPSHVLLVVFSLEDIKSKCVDRKVVWRVNVHASGFCLRLLWTPALPTGLREFQLFVFCTFFSAFLQKLSCAISLV